MAKVIKKTNDMWFDLIDNDVWITPMDNGNFKVHHRHTSHSTQVFETESQAVEYMVDFIMDREMEHAKAGVYA